MNRKIEKILQRCAETGDYAPFYGTADWKAIEAQVRKLDHNECQLCRARGRYRRGYIVHHRKHLCDFPELALSIFVPETGERNLVTVCKRCHEDEHPEALHAHGQQTAPLTAERWD